MTGCGDGSDALLALAAGISRTSLQLDGDLHVLVLTCLAAYWLGLGMLVVRSFNVREALAPAFIAVLFSSIIILQTPSMAMVYTLRWFIDWNAYVGLALTWFIAALVPGGCLLVLNAFRSLAIAFTRSSAYSRSIERETSASKSEDYQAAFPDAAGAPSNDDVTEESAHSTGSLPESIAGGTDMDISAPCNYEERLQEEDSDGSSSTDAPGVAGIDLSEHENASESQRQGAEECSRSILPQLRNALFSKSACFMPAAAVILSFLVIWPLVGILMGQVPDLKKIESCNSLAEDASAYPWWVYFAYWSGALLVAMMILPFIVLYVYFAMSRIEAESTMDLESIVLPYIPGSQAPEQADSLFSHDIHRLVERST